MYMYMQLHALASKNHTWTVFVSSSSTLSKLSSPLAYLPIHPTVFISSWANHISIFIDARTVKTIAGFQFMCLPVGFVDWLVIAPKGGWIARGIADLITEGIIYVQMDSVGTYAGLS